MRDPQTVMPLALILKGNKIEIADGQHRTAILRQILAEIAAEAKSNHR